MPLWWSLALRACLGETALPSGASANVIIVGKAEKMGKPISFKRFMVNGMPLMPLDRVGHHQHTLRMAQVLCP